MLMAPIAQIRQPDVGVRHHCLGAAGREVVAVCHAHRGVLVGDHDGSRQGDILGGGFCQALDDRREIRAGIRKNVVHADGLQPGQEGAAGGDGFGRL